MNKIQRVSCFFRVLFQITFVILPILDAIAWMYAPTPLSFQGLSFDMIGAHGYPILGPISTNIKLLGFLISMIPLGFELLTLYFLIKLFKLYEQGEIFSIRNVNFIRKTGYTMLIGQLVNPIYQVLISVTLTWHNKLHGVPRYATISFDGTSIGIILTSLMIILISWIMAEGCKLREEQQLTV